MDGETFAIAGGADHKTGQVDDPARCYTEVEAWLTRLAPDARVTERWSGQVVETADFLPIIGTVAERQFIATGFAGNGMTFGTLAAVMARDAITGVTNPWQELFEIDRSVVSRGPWKYLTENVDYPYYLVRDRFAGVSKRSLRSIRRNSGEVVTVDGHIVAVVQERERQTRHAFTELHSSWLSGAVERDGPHVGMPVPWLPIPADRGGYRGPRRARLWSH